MTELNDHLKLLFARAAQLYLPRLRRSRCAATRRDDLRGDARARRGARRSAPRHHLPGRRAEELHRGGGHGAPASAGLHAHPRARGHACSKSCRTASAWAAPRRRASSRRSRRRSASGSGRVQRVRVDDEARQRARRTDVWRFSTDLHCSRLRHPLRDPTPASSRSTRRSARATTCRGFGRVIGIDYGLIVPDEAKTLREGAVKPVADARASTNARTIS